MSWLCAAPVRDWGRRERVAVTLAGIAPDVDGAGYVIDTFAPFWGAQTYLYQQYHHILAHNLAFALLAAVIGALVARQKKALAAALCFLAANLHFLGDIVGSKGPDGYQWPIPYLYPFNDDLQVVWSGQWELNAWPNILIAGLVILGVGVISRKKGYSPFELVSKRIDAAVFEMTAALKNKLAPRRG